MQRLVRCQQNMQRLISPSNRLISPSNRPYNLFEFGPFLLVARAQLLEALAGISDPFELHSGISEPLTGISELHWYIDRKVSAICHHRVTRLAEWQSARLQSRRSTVRILVISLLFARRLFLSSISLFVVNHNFGRDKQR